MSDMRQVLPGAPTAQWTPWGSYQDILVDRCADGLARVAINRPAKRNAFRPQTVMELCDAFTRIRDDRDIGVVLFTGVGPAPDGGYAFCSGGDQSVRGDGGYVVAAPRGAESRDPQAEARAAAATVAVAGTAEEQVLEPLVSFQG